MAKLYLNVNMRVIVDTDLTSISEIMENMDCFAVTEDFDKVLVIDHQVTNVSIEDAK